MTKSTTKKSKLTMLALAVVASLAVTAASGTAKADSEVTCVPQVVEYYGGTLIVQCPGVINYYAQLSSQGTGGGGCSAQSADTLKSFQSLAMAALLAGKNVRIVYNTCSNGTKGFWALDLKI
jgi:hypothetical protein